MTDILFGQMDGLLRNRFLMGFWLILASWMSYDTFTQPSLQKHSLGIKIFTALLLGGIIFSILFAFTLVVTGLMILFRKNKGLVGEHVLSITNEGLVEQTEFNQNMHRWNGFHRVAQTRRHMYIYVTETNYYAVPLKRPLLEGDLVEFKKELLAKIQSGK